MLKQRNNIRIVSGAGTGGKASLSSTKGSGTATKSSNPTDLAMADAMERLQLDFANTAILSLLPLAGYYLFREFAINFTSMTISLPSELYVEYTGPTGSIGSVFTLLIGIAFWYGWIVMTKIKGILKPNRQSIWSSPLTPWGIGATLGELVPSKVNTLMRQTVAILIGLAFSQYLLYKIASLISLPSYLMAPNLLLMATLQCIVLPASIVRNTTCRQFGAGAVFALLVQSPLILGMTIYTMATAAVAVLHTTLGVDRCVELLGQPMVVDSYPLWIKFAVIGCLSIWSIAATASGGALGVLLNRRKNRRLDPSSTKRAILSSRQSTISAEAAFDQ